RVLLRTGSGPSTRWLHRERRTPDTQAVTADTDALRSNTRRLGDTLGLVIVEQEGEELLALEERARKLAIAGRRGSAEAMEQLVAFLGPLDLERQALVLRAFAVYFQLANIAEQHHRIRR